MSKRALISVSDKEGIVEFAKGIRELGWEIISTGGTKAVLDQEEIPNIAIDEVTGFPEMMDGRLKTLHPLIHGALLGRRDLESHMKSMTEHHISPIDLVVVNLYPFKETLLAGGSQAEMIEKIDIGGPSMLRSAAKNHASVTVVCDPYDYEKVLTELSVKGETSLSFRQQLAAKVFRHTASYDALIAQYLTEEFPVENVKPEKLTLTYDLKQGMRYGENPQQNADFYESALPTTYSIAQSKQIHGKELSYNNVRDADAALQIARDFEEPTVVALKHMNPCGIGTATDIEKAWDYAYEADPVSIFGGIIVLNREVTLATAQKMSKIFLEIIIAPSYSKEALEVLSKKKNIRLLTVDFSKKEASEKEALVTGVLGGLLVQNQDVIVENPKEWTVATKVQPTDRQMVAMKFAWKAVKFVKSNGIIVTNDHQTLGVGPGQTNRVGSVKIALEATAEKSVELQENAVLGSDAFFPFADNIDEIAKAGIKAIVQPGGSVRDQEVIDACDKYGIAMVFTGLRHFRH
ncbi:bifunctional phosphoribosylaminoimidazolecarboxamide formyltransferase/IMP cyclohydrolase [Lactococcus lactis]|uniref:bifunctional phosphoribosylaminoimidazolecarboxamide formyltransferase/IMP cyclohydrolase n=1 Tax=Lactococcus lactis TaxID=1358 RepID=UPI0024186485|nr:bifunctional phosphoribosylaminoimidazolecarboxamide formyltransferase/IMP cyclohydrolase [Lactococcus lactis]MDG4963095.1 bifunctional phosphoribosylaminoimidazolecarboxamide formyltransferase/IMP cyclohydrolase [Lactococcus lactis]